MSDKELFTAYLWDGFQMLLVIFEFEQIEFWAEPENQERLKSYFEANHFTRARPLHVVKSEVFDIMPFKPPAK